MGDVAGDQLTLKPHDSVSIILVAKHERVVLRWINNRFNVAIFVYMSILHNKQTIINRRILHNNRINVGIIF